MTVALDVQQGLAVVRIDDGKVNAITQAVVEALADALVEAESAASAIVLTGRPGAFCAGFDRAVMVGDDPDARGALGLGGAQVARRLFACGKPTVAASTGHAFTIGALWLMACDTRYGERGPYQYAMTETVMGATLSGWPLALLESRVPPRLMTPIAVQSLALGPEAAIEAGYIDEVVDAGSALERAVETAERLTKLPTEAYAANKRAVRAPILARIDAALG